MFVIAIAGFIALVLTALYIAVILGMRQAHPTDLSLQRPTLLAALACRVLGLYVRREHQEAVGAERERVAR